MNAHSPSSALPYYPGRGEIMRVLIPTGLMGPFAGRPLPTAQTAVAGADPVCHMQGRASSVDWKKRKLSGRENSRALQLRVNIAISYLLNFMSPLRVPVTKKKKKTKKKKEELCFYPQRRSNSCIFLFFSLLLLNHIQEPLC